MKVLKEIGKWIVSFCILGAIPAVFYLIYKYEIIGWIFIGIVVIVFASVIKYIIFD